LLVPSVFAPDTVFVLRLDPRYEYVWGDVREPFRRQWFRVSEV